MACFLQSYAAALAERVPRFTVHEEHDGYRYVEIPNESEAYQVTTLSQTEEGLLGTSLAGDQVFLLPFNLPSSVSELRTTLAHCWGWRQNGSRCCARVWSCRVGWRSWKWMH